MEMTFAGVISTKKDTIFDEPIATTETFGITNDVGEWLTRLVDIDRLFQKDTNNFDSQTRVDFDKTLEMMPYFNGYALYVANLLNGYSMTVTSKVLDDNEIKFLQSSKTEGRFLYMVTKGILGSKIRYAKNH